MSLRKSVISAIFCFSAIAAFASPIKVEDLKPSKNLPEDRPSVALVLAGGGAKGFAELPIMEYIDQLDIPIDSEIKIFATVNFNKALNNKYIEKSRFL